MEGRVERVARPADRTLHVMEEPGRAERELQDVVEVLEPGRVAQPHPHLAEPADGEPVAGREPGVLVLETAVRLPDAGAVVGVALEVAAVGLPEALPGGPVHVVDRAVGHRRQAPGDERLPQALRGDREVGQRGEAAEALAKHAPAIHAQLPSDGLAVAHDRVGPEVRQVGGLLRRGLARDVRPDGRGPAGPALVEEQHPVLGEGPLHPA